MRSLQPPALAGSRCRFLSGWHTARQFTDTWKQVGLSAPPAFPLLSSANSTQRDGHCLITVNVVVNRLATALQACRCRGHSRAEGVYGQRSGSVGKRRSCGIRGRSLVETHGRRC